MWLPLLLCAACAPRPGPPGTGGAGAAPALDRVEPDSAPAGEAYPVRLVLTGGPFDPTGNVVRLGSVLADTLDSPDGTSLVWPMPKSSHRGGEVPPEVLQPGRYELTVETRAGRSLPLTFTLVPGEG